MKIHEFNTTDSNFKSFPELEDSMRRHSRIVYSLSQGEEYKRHKATHDHYQDQLIALLHEYNRLGGSISFSKKIIRLFKCLERIRELEENHDKLINEGK